MNSHHHGAHQGSPKSVGFWPRTTKLTQIRSLGKWNMIGMVGATLTPFFIFNIITVYTLRIDPLWMEIRNWTSFEDALILNLETWQ